MPVLRAPCHGAQLLVPAACFSAQAIVARSFAGSAGSKPVSCWKVSPSSAASVQLKSAVRLLAGDTARVVNALTSVLGEVLALRSPSDTEAVIERICHWREYWSQRDHIHAQRPPAGRA